MAKIVNEFDLADILQDHLENAVKDQVRKNLIEKMVGEFKIELEKIIEPELEKFTVGGVESVKDMFQLYENLNVNVVWRKQE